MSWLATKNSNGRNASAQAKHLIQIRSPWECSELPVCDWSRSVTRDDTVKLVHQTSSTLSASIRVRLYWQWLGLLQSWPAVPLGCEKRAEKRPQNATWIDLDSLTGRSQAVLYETLADTKVVWLLELEAIVIALLACTSCDLVNHTGSRVRSRLETRDWKVWSCINVWHCQIKRPLYIGPQRL